MGEATEKSVYKADDAELIVAAVAMRSAETFPDRFLALDEVTAACFYRESGVESLSESIYRAGLIREGTAYKYQTVDAIRDHLGVDRKLLEPYFKYMNRPIDVVLAARDRMIEAAQRRSFATKLERARYRIENAEVAIDQAIADTVVEITGVGVASKRPGRTGAEIASSYGKVAAWAQYPAPRIFRSEHPMDYTPFGVGAYNVFLAPPGTGKTVLALWKAIEVAQAGGYVIWNGWEMDGPDLIDMYISRVTGLDYQDLIDAREGEAIGDETLMRALTDEERALRDQALAEIFAEGGWGHRIRFLTGGDAIAMNNLLPVIRRLRAAGMADLLVLDHLHIAKVLDERGNPITDEFKRVTAASAWARDISADTGIPMFVAAQFNRTRKEARQDGDAPDLFTMEMIRASGAIEQDAYGITAIQIVQYNPNTGEVKRYKFDGNAPNNGLQQGYVKALMGQVMKNRKGGGRLSNWVVPIIDGRYDYDLDMLRGSAARYGLE